MSSQVQVIQVSGCQQLSSRDHTVSHRFIDTSMDKLRAPYFTANEQHLLMETFEELKHIILKKGNTAAIIKERERAWQTIADRLNAQVATENVIIIHSRSY